MSEPALLSMRVRPRTPADHERLAAAWPRLMRDDAAIRASVDARTADVLVQGASERQLAVVIDRLRRECGVDVSVGPLEIVYTEVCTRSAHGGARFVSRMSDARGSFAHVKIELQPRAVGSGYAFENAIVGGLIPERFIAAVDDGIREALPHGVLAGYPLDDLKIVLYDGSYHAVDSSEQAFRIAGTMALAKP